MKVLKILKINQIIGSKIYCTFSNMENRVIDFNSMFKSWNLMNKPNDFRYSLLNKKVFDSVQIKNYTLNWESIRKEIKLSNGKTFNVPFELDPIVLYDASLPDEKRNKKQKLGDILRSARQASKITQAELAARIGSTKNYISKIENNNSDIELNTLRKIVEIGLNKKLLISFGEKNTYQEQLSSSIVEEKEHKYKRTTRSYTRSQEKVTTTRLDDKLALYSKALGKTSKTAVDAALLKAAAKACGPSIYRKDAAYVAFSDPKELERVKTNFLEKKLGVKGKKADEAIAAVKETYKARLKHRPVVYYLLTKHCRKKKKLIG